MPLKTIFDTGPSNISNIKVILVKNESPLERAHKTKRNDPFPRGGFSKMHQSRDAKQLVTMRLFLRMRSMLLLCEHNLSKALIQLPRNIEDSAIAHLTSYLEFLFTVQSVLYRESSEY